MSSTNINHSDLENIATYRKESSSVVNINNSQRIIPNTQHKNIIQTQSRSQIFQRSNSNISNSNTMANSSLYLNSNINTSLNSGVNNSNVLNSSLLRSSIVMHAKQLSSGAIASKNYVNNYCNIAGAQKSLSNSSYSKALTSIDISDGSSKSSQNVSMNAYTNNKIQNSMSSTLSQLKQHAIKKYKQQQQQQQENQNLTQIQASQTPPYHFEKGISKTHRGHTNSNNNFRYIQQYQNQSVSNILGNSQKQNMIQSSPSTNLSNKRVNTMPSQNSSSTGINKINDENTFIPLNSSINIQSYKISPCVQNNNLITNQNPLKLQQTPLNELKQNNNNFSQTCIISHGKKQINSSNNLSQLDINNENNSSNNISNALSNQSNNFKHQISTHSNQSNSTTKTSKSSYIYNLNDGSLNQNSINIQQHSSQNPLKKRVLSQEKKYNNYEDENMNLEKMIKEIEAYKQREIQYLSRINILEEENKQVNESVQKSENNILNLKQEIVKVQQQSHTVQNTKSKNSQHTNSQNQELLSPSNQNINIQLQQKQIVVLETYVETLNKKVQQLEMEQIRQQNQNTQYLYEKQSQTQKSQYKQLVEKYISLEKLFDQISSENAFYKINLQQLKEEYAQKQSCLEISNGKCQQQSQNSILKALSIVQLINK